MKYTLMLTLLLACFFSSYAQSNQKLGLGYFGHTVTHPGMVLEYEWEKQYSPQATLPLRVDLGFYSHPRNHDGLFLDVNLGFRRYYQSGLFLEESIGIGVLQTILNADGTFAVNDAGQVSKASSWNEPDFIPSITLGLGYDLSKNKNKQTLIWLRPKIAWQIPHKTSSTFHPIVQIGMSHRISSKE